MTDSEPAFNPADHLPPDPASRVPDEEVIRRGLSPMPDLEFVGAEEKFEYPLDTPEEARLRDILRYASAMMGEHLYTEDRFVPANWFSDEYKKAHGIPADVTHIKTTIQERSNYNTFFHDAGDQAGGFTLTLTERNRYYPEDEVEPLRASLTLHLRRGSVSLGLIVPSRHMSTERSNWKRDIDERVGCRMVVAAQSQPTEPAALQKAFEEFLSDVEIPFVRTAFEELRPFFTAGTKVDGAWHEPTAQQKQELARFFEMFFRGNKTPGADEAESHT